MKDPLLPDGTPLIRQYTTWSWAGDDRCVNPGDVAEIRLATGRIVNVKLSEDVDGVWWLVDVGPSLNDDYRNTLSQRRARLMPALQLLTRIAQIDSGELEPGDRPDDLRGFKRLKTQAAAAAHGLRELVGGL